MGKYFVTHGEEVSGFYSRTVNSAKEAAKFCNTKYFSELDSLIEVSDTLFITVTDGAIKEVWDCIAAKDVKGKSVCHFSGSLSSDIFSNAEQAGVSVCSLHPINFNNEIGLPLTIFRLSEEDEVAVLEMGISDFNEMHRLGAIARPDICVITNIGLCHLENLGSRDGILKAKTEIFEHLNGTGTVILNGEDDRLSTVENVNGKVPVFYGKSEKNQCGKENCIYVTEIRNLGLDGMKAVFHFPECTKEVEIPIPGEHNVLNALAGACVGMELGLDVEQICAGIKKAQTIGGRTNLIHANDMLIIDDCYNANPVSMRASIDVLTQAKGRMIAVLGDMGELGADEKRLHYEVGAYAASRGLDALFCCGELSKELAKGAEEHSETMEIFYFATKEELLLHLKSYLKKGDTILVKASHFMEFPDIVRSLQASVQ